MATAIAKRISALEKVVQPSKLSPQESTETMLRNYGVTMEEVIAQYGSVPAFAYAKMREPLTEEMAAKHRADVEKYGGEEQAYMAMLRGK